MTDGIAGQRLDAKISSGARLLERVEIDVRDVNRIPRQAMRVGDAGCQLSENRNRRPLSRRRCSPAGHQPWRLMRSRLNGHACDFADAFDDSLDVEEVHVAGAAAPVFRLRHSRPCARERAALAMRAREARANLEQPHVALFTAAVVRDRIDEARQRRRPQNGKCF